VYFLKTLEVNLNLYFKETISLELSVNLTDRYVKRPKLVEAKWFHIFRCLRCNDPNFKVSSQEVNIKKKLNSKKAPPGSDELPVDLLVSCRSAIHV
jgi:hypothetical protein